MRIFSLKRLSKKTVLALSVTTAISLILSPALNAGADSDINNPEQVTFNSQLVDAAEVNDAALISALLNFDANPNERGDFGTTALIRAAYHGSGDITEMLLKKGANPNLADIGGATPLHIAARQGNKQVAEMLIKYGAKIDSTDKEGNTPLMTASASNSTEIVKILADAGSDVNKTNHQGETAIIYAADSKNAGSAKLLVESGADTNVVDQEGSNLANITARKASEQLISAIGKMNLPESVPEFLQEKVFDLADTQPNKIDWFKDLKNVLSEDKGKLEHASMTNYQQGQKYIIINLGSFKGKEFASKKAAELKSKYPDLFSSVGISVSEKDGTFTVNAGIFDNNADAEKICKKLTADGSSCRIVETTLLSKDQFNQIAGVVPPAAPAAPIANEVNDIITPAPVEKVEAKLTDKIESAKAQATKVETKIAAPVKSAPQKIETVSENIGSALAPMSEQANQEEEKSMSDLLEIAAKPAAKPVEKPIQTAAITQKDQNDMTALIEKINTQTPKPAAPAVVPAAPAPEVKKPEVAKTVQIKPELAKPAEPTKQQEASSFERLKALVANDEPTAKPPEAKQLAKAEPEAKPEAPKVLNNKEKVESKISKPAEAVMPTPALEKKPQEKLPVEANLKTEQPKIEIKSEAPVIKASEAVVAKPAMPELPKPVALEPTKPVSEEKPQPEKVEAEKKLPAPSPEPKIVKIPQEEKKTVLATTKLQPELAKPPVSKQLAADSKPQNIIPPILPKPQVQAQAQAPVPVEAPKSEPITVVVAPKDTEQKIKELPPITTSATSADKAKPVVVIAEQKPENQEKFKVATPIKVENLNSQPPVISQNTTSKTSGISPRSGYGAKQYWVKVDSFDAEDDVFSFWKHVSGFANNPNAGAIAVQSSATGKYIAQVGPFLSATDTSKFCDAIYNYGEENGQDLRCMTNRILPNTRSYNSSSDLGAGSGATRHSDLNSSSMGISSGMTRHSDLRSSSPRNFVFNPNEPGNYYVQIGSYSSSEDALARWDALKTQVDLLQNHEPKIISSSGRSSSGKVYLRTGNFEFRDSADDLCTTLRQKMISCIIVKA